MPTSDAILQVLGRAHPMVLHLPIGLLAALVALELWSAWARRRSPEPSARTPAALVLWLSVFASLAAAASGLVLAEEGTHAGVGMSVHRTLGLVFTGVLCVAACCHAFGFRKTYLRLLVVGLLVMVPAGHFGAALTHGERFLYAPLLANDGEPDVPVVAPTDGSITFASHIAPVLDARCVSCHGPDARKGGLRLDSFDAIERGGSSGVTLAAGKPDASPLLTRMRLPLDHDEHMPPESKTQPTPAEIDLIEAWILAGAPPSGPFDAPGLVVAEAAEPEATVEDRDRLPPAPAANADDVRRLTESFVHVSPVAPGDPALWVDLAPIATTFDDERFDELIAPVAPSLGELHAARTLITDRSLAALSRAEALTTLDLSSTRISVEGLAHLGALPNLRVLRVVGTDLNDDAIASIARLPALERVYLWRTGVSDDAIASLRSQRPDLEIDTGSIPDDAIETEGELVFSGDRPVPGDPAVASTKTVSLEPFNASCPVSGAPADPAHAVVYEGRVIGFCCANCLKSFVDDPEQYAATLDER